MQTLELIFWILLISAGLNIVVWSLYNGISPMLTSPKVKKMLFAVLPKEIPGSIYELGSGWGTLTVPLALQYPSSLVIGYETSPVPYLISKLRAAVKGLPNLKIYKENFLKVSLEDAAMVICYLYPDAMKRLKSKFQDELAPGAWLVSHTFAVPGWQPHAVYEVEDLYKTKIYVYRMMKKTM